MALSMLSQLHSLPCGLALEQSPGQLPCKQITSQWHACLHASTFQGTHLGGQRHVLSRPSISTSQTVGDRGKRRMASTGPVQRIKAQASTSVGASVTGLQGQSDKALVQHTFGLPTAPGPNFANTFPMYDVTFTSIDFHKTIGHTINTLILLLPTLYYWNDPRWKFVLLAKLTLPEAVWEQATHYFTRQLHNVHKLKIVPLLILDAIFFANGGAQQVLSGPKDGLYYFMLYYFVVFMGGNLVEAFITFFGKYWPIKAPGSV